MIIRDGRLLVPESLRAVIIQIAHEGHLGQQKTLGLLRQTVWFPNMEGLVKEYVETCVPCQAAQPKTAHEPINPTEYPEGLRQTFHADFKGPVAKSWYLHVLIDQYSKYPVVHVVDSTSWENLHPVLEETMACHRVPKVIVTDGGQG